MKYKLMIFAFSVFITLNHVSAQTLPVGLLPNTDDAVRRQQLLGIDTSNSSFMIRPLFLSDRDDLNLSDDPNGISLKNWSRLLWNSRTGTAEVRALPIVWQQQINTHHPYGWNDGAMIPAKGYQTSFSAGIFAKVGPLTVQLRPEYVYANNPYFRENLDANNPVPLRNALMYFYNTIDLPERFGTRPFSELNWGQSSIRLNFDPVSVGLSNESLWWGPGVRNSLLMSNNAPGFKHITLNTIKPVNTPIGSFEAQIIAGRLEGSGIMQRGIGFTPKRDDWRYISGIVFTLQPKWVPGLYLGFDRTFTTYREDMGSGFTDYLPIFSAFQKKSFNNEDNTVNTEDGVKRDQIFSLFARWVMPESHSEVYFQYGKEDHSWDIRDAVSEPEHSRAYVAGFRKLIPLAADDTYIQIGLELTQTEPPGTKEVRGETSWYTHTSLAHGYTNKGQIIGAGIGPDNLQSLDVDWVRGLKKIGLTVERRTRNNELYYNAFSNPPEFRRHWTDLGFGGKFDWEYKSFILSSQLTYIRSLNYQYQFEGQDPQSLFDWDKQDVNNLHFKIGLMYRL
jgi:hypothetical protein